MFVKGKSGNPKGRPKGSKDFFSFEKLVRSIKKVQKENIIWNKKHPSEEQKPTDLFEHIIQRAFDCDKVLVVLMTKIIPNMPAGNESEDLNGRELILYDIPQNGGMNRLKRFIQ